MTTEYQRAQAWADRCGFDRDRLAELTGYSPVTLYWFMRGCTPPARNAKSGSKSRIIKPWVWQRFKMACAGAEADLKTRNKFDW